tara:strand:- start:431 stop:1165 length:735 start_codon:yes stop_codon:yes gene_type:complete
MKYRFFFFLIILASCSSVSVNKYEKPVFNSKGFAYIYSIEDYEKKIIKKKINNYEPLIAHNQLNRGVLLKITNPKNGKNIILKNSFKLNYPDFYKILITKSISEQIGLDENFPFVEVEELKKNKSFIAKKAETHEEEKQLKVKAPIEKVKISNISKSIKKKFNKEHNFVIVLGNFYSLESANLLKKRVKMESQSLRDRKITILKKNKHNFEVFLGPYKTIKAIKNDYIALKQINFDEIDIKVYE